MARYEAYEFQFRGITRARVTFTFFGEDPGPCGVDVEIDSGCMDALGNSVWTMKVAPDLVPQLIGVAVARRAAGVAPSVTLHPK